ncbi:MAG: phosphoribosylglycinamide formyltransferase [Gammaproteobacteria bacterium RIFCSPHIGHO2_12_FULL_63_22]|nr:MAG: phosphoribosylglycinamide formyltransferase [Gammaproteobacteria bacterium RIFCSPHIGHO2_12_FULL_63_22]
MRAPLRIAVLASGRGSNLRALLQARLRGELPIDVVGVFSDRPGCAALALAGEAGIPSFAQRPADFASRSEFDDSMFNRIEAVQPDLIVCAGYMRLISDAAVSRFKGKIINIHPSLLPKYPGLHTHARALAAGDREHGASVHCVIPELDAGAVIAHTRIPVLAGDGPESLSNRLLEREHQLLVQTVKAIADGDLDISGNQPRWHGVPIDTPLSSGPNGHLEDQR